MAGAPAYSPNVAPNVEFLGERARQLADQEIERARSLDTKAAGIVAGAIALIAAGAGFAGRVYDLRAGGGAKSLWAIELSATLVLLLLAGGFAVWAISPKAYRTVVAYRELERWVTPRVLTQDPIEVRGTLLHADVRSVGHARDVNKSKAHRMQLGFACFAAALACIVALGVSVVSRAPAFHGATRTTDNRTRGAIGAGVDARRRRPRQADVSPSRTRHRPSRGPTRRRKP